MGGGDKCLLPFGAKPILAHVIAALGPQTSALLLSSNSDPARFADFGLPVLADAVPGFQGPLAGVLTGMLWCRRHHPHASHVLSVAADMPRLPADLATRMVQSLARDRADIVIASDSHRSHPVLGLWPVDLAERLDADLKQTTIRSLHRWLSAFRVASCAFPQEAFLNINTREDLARGHRSSPGWGDRSVSDFTEKIGYF